MRSEARYIAKKGTLEDKTKLLNYLKIIKNDKSFDTFKMEPKTKYDHRLYRLCEYIFTLDYGEKIYKDEPFVNDSLDYFGEGGDKYFISELGSFIKQHYGEDVYKLARDSKPECVQKYLDALESAQNQLKTDIRDTLNLEPLNYMLMCDGRKIPTTSSGIVDNDYVC